MERVTPEDIKFPVKGQVILVGTNESGIHGAGLALHANKHWGLPLGWGFGPYNQCFALPTKDWEVNTLPLETIRVYVNRYIAWLKMIRNNYASHAVTRIGCGLAGYTPEDIAPMFAECINMRKVSLPQDFIDVIKSKEHVIDNASK